MTDSEFARAVRLDALGEGEHVIAIAASPEERDRLAARFGLLAVDRLDAEVRMTRAGRTVDLRGRFSADVTQSCVTTREPIAVTVADTFTLRFLPEDETPDDPGTEIGLSDEDCDTLFYRGGEIDVGEAVAETMILALDPFPRHPAADAILAAAGGLPNDDASPFAALKALRGRPPE
jgi:uncharacterized metal-binding protein YceD (DUF177 family)